MSNRPPPPRRPPSGDREASPGRYALTSDRPPRARRKSEAPPDPDAPPSSEAERTVVHGSFQPPAPIALPQPPPRMPRETMRGFAARPDADSTMQIGSFAGGSTPFPSTGAGGVIAQATDASYPGPMATPVASPTPFPGPPASAAPSSDNEPTTFYRRPPSGQPPAAPPTTTAAAVEPPPDTARKVSISPAPMQSASSAPPPAVSRQTARIISSNPPPPAAAQPISSAPPPANPPEQKPQGPAGVAWEDGFDPANDVEWQKLWLATQRRAWRSLAIVPVGEDIDTVRIAQALALLAWHHLGKTIKVFDATHLALSDLERRLSDMSSRVARGESVIVAFGQIVNSPASLTLARATDAALLFVQLRYSRIADAEKTLAEMGSERFIGSVVLDDAGQLR